MRWASVDARRAARSSALQVRRDFGERLLQLKEVVRHPHWRFVGEWVGSRGVGEASERAVGTCKPVGDPLGC